jgi:trypsin
MANSQREEGVMRLLHRAGSHFPLILLLSAAAPAIAHNGPNDEKAGKAATPPAATPAKTQRPAKAPDIVGGTPAGPNDNPFQVGLLRKDQLGNVAAQFCGGSLIAPTLVVTAAHCGYHKKTSGGPTVRWEPGEVQVLVGTRSLLQGGVRLNVVSIKQHPNYDPATQDYDVALWKLASPAAGIPLARLAVSDGVPGNMLLVTGWGATSDGGTDSPVLLKVSVPIVSHQTCSAALGPTITPRMLCAGFSSGGRDSCQGDSGGPATRGTGNMMLTGVVSWGNGCARSNSYGVYARVSDPSIRDFILGGLTKPKPSPASKKRRAK